MIVVANLYKLATEDNVFSLKHKTLERSKAKVSKNYADMINKNYLTSGHYYEILEKETEDWNNGQFKTKKKVEPIKETVVTEIGQSEVKDLKKKLTKLKK